MKSLKSFTVVVLAAGLLGSCSSMNKTQKGAVIGAGSGAVVGGVVGRAAGNTALGAIIGAAVGGTAGGVIGRRMDKQAEEIEQSVPGAKVERVGEGIVVEFSEAVLFATNQSTLNNAAYNSLNNLATILKKYPDTDLEIDGHTDSKGTEQYNQQLSEKRAEAVAGYLAAQNIARSRMTTKGFGELHPKYSNDTEEGRAGNRRVEFQITANEEMKRQAELEAQ